jgi:hypothetical protein
MISAVRRRRHPARRVIGLDDESLVGLGVRQLQDEVLCPQELVECLDARWQVFRYTS